MPVVHLLITEHNSETVEQETEQQRVADNSLTVGDANINKAIEPQESDKGEGLDQNVLNALGSNPISQKASNLVLNEQVAKILLYIKNNGADKKELSDLKAKYNIPEDFQPPDLLSGIETNAAARHLKREHWRLKVQEDLCPALAINASIITLVMAEKKKHKTPELENIEALLCESSRLIANAIWQETESRKTLIAPAFIPSLRQIVKKSTTDTKLIGENIVEKAKQHIELRSIMQQEKSLRPFGGRNNYGGNFRFKPFPGRPPTPSSYQWQQWPAAYNPQAQSIAAPPFSRQKLSSGFRPRKLNQPLNTRLLNRAGALMNKPPSTK